MTTFLAFVIAIVILVFIHELGHFLFAKWVGCRVDEFSVGFRPALWQKKWGETNYVLGLIPVGGYVKIWGENGSEEVEEDPSHPRAFYNRPRWAQALVLLGGIVFNILLAWLCFSLLLATGFESSTSRYADADVANKEVQIISLVEGYPAASSSLEVGSTIESIESVSGERLNDPEEWQAVQDFLERHGEEGVSIEVTQTGGEKQVVNLEAEPYEDRSIVGLSLDTVGVVSFPLGQAFTEGAKLTYDLSITIVLFLRDFFVDLSGGSFDKEAVSGPVGIASYAGDSLKSGVSDFTWFIGILSLNLAIFNLLPIPALDGGRLVFVAIESLIRRPINPKWFMYINAFGFILLILLMVVVTIGDISQLL